MKFGHSKTLVTLLEMKQHYKRVNIGSYNSIKEVYTNLGLTPPTQDNQIEELSVFFEFEFIDNHYVNITRIKSDEEVEKAIKSIRTSRALTQAMEHARANGLINKSNKYELQKYDQLEPIGEYVNRKGVYLIMNEDNSQLYVGYTLDRSGFKDRLNGHYRAYRHGQANKWSELVVTDSNAKMYWLCLFDEESLPTRQEAEHIEQQFIALFKHHYPNNLLNKFIKKNSNIPCVDNINIELLVELGIMQVA